MMTFDFRIWSGWIAILLLPFCLKSETVDVSLTTMILDDGVSTEEWVGDAEAGVQGLQVANLYMWSGNASRAVTVPFGSFSLPFRYQGSSVLRFYDRPYFPDLDDAPSPVAQVTLPSEGDDFALLFLTQSTAPLRFRLLPIPLDSSKEAGELRFTNLTRRTLAWRVGSESGTIQPLESRTVRLGENGGTARVRFQIASHDAASERWTVVYRRLLRPHADQRYEGFIIPRSGTGGGGVRVRLIADDIGARNQVRERGGARLRVIQPPEEE